MNSCLPAAVTVSSALLVAEAVNSALLVVAAVSAWMAVVRTVLPTMYDKTAISEQAKAVSKINTLGLKR